MKKLFGLFRLIRFELPFAAGACVVLGQLLALEKFASLNLVSAGFFSVFFISGAILVLNDYFDVETDKINAPHRPIPSNIVTKEEALLFSVILFIAGLFLSHSINLTAFICAILLTVIGILYNRKFKKSGLTGNLMVSFSVGMTFIFGGISVGSPFNEVVWLFALIAALIDLGEEIAADAMDAKGDTLINSKSIAIKYGKETAIKVSVSIFIFVILLTLLPIIKNWFSKIYIIPIFIIIISIAFPSYKLLKSKDEEGRKYIRYIYLGSTAGIIIFIIMKLFGL